jgi:hypothetical protein
VEPDLRFVVEAGGNDDDFCTMLYVYRGEEDIAGHGMQGPKFDWDEPMFLSTAAQMMCPTPKLSAHALRLTGWSSLPTTAPR